MKGKGLGFIKSGIPYAITFFSVYYGSGLIYSGHYWVGVPLTLLGSISIFNLTDKAYSK